VFVTGDTVDDLYNRLHNGRRRKLLGAQSANASLLHAMGISLPMIEQPDDKMPSNFRQQERWPLSWCRLPV
jgi:hypothetical protein